METVDLSDIPLDRFFIIANGAHREHLGARQTFFNDIRTLTRYLCFDSWNHLLDFMIEQLGLDIPPAPT
jgi:hypothetical protein